MVRWEGRERHEYIPSIAVNLNNTSVFLQSTPAKTGDSNGEDQVDLEDVRVEVVKF